MPLYNPRRLDVVRHRIRGYRVPFLLILQHHDIPASTRLAAPVTPSLPGDVDVLAPRISIGGRELRVRLLDTSAVSRSLFSEVEASAVDIADSISTALDIILHGYPVRLPI
ncbi:MAG TPA: hypothetical protein VFG62_26710 [Rhodopila sp.]|jgi:hypothetical protein|nr:hypothetical protein [Rhodopila sp.]